MRRVSKSGARAATCSHGGDGDVRWMSDGDYSMAFVELDEAAHGGVDRSDAACVREPRRVGARQRDAAFPAHLELFRRDQRRRRRRGTLSPLLQRPRSWARTLVRGQLSGGLGDRFAQREQARAGVCDRGARCRARRWRIRGNGARGAIRASTARPRRASRAACARRRILHNYTFPERRRWSATPRITPATSTRSSTRR